jgi:pimeloyl-ACP methyl ester carboxylesterase
MGMKMVKTGISVPGANLYYEVRGTGPVLLMIHGGGGDADKFSAVTPLLADCYKVVTSDRRSHSRSRLTIGMEEYRVETHSEDAHQTGVCIW